MHSLVPGIHVLNSGERIKGVDGRDKPGLYALKSLLDFCAHHTGTTQWIFVVSSVAQFKTVVYVSARPPSLWPLSIHI
jgi:hypothetical protein